MIIISLLWCFIIVLFIICSPRQFVKEEKKFVKILMEIELYEKKINNLYDNNC